MENFREFRARKQNQRQPGRYKDVLINRPDDGNWYVSYLYQQSNENHRMFKEFGQLKAYTGDNKEAQAEILRKDVIEWLDAGNSPYGGR